jgi:hypothetical protein
MISSEVQRTLVKSPPELWAELSDPKSLARHLGELGEIRITRAEPEKLLEWEAETASGTVAIKPSGWGTKVTLTATREFTPAPPEEETPEAEPAEPEAIEPATSEPEPTEIPIAEAAPTGEPMPSGLDAWSRQEAEIDPEVAAPESEQETPEPELIQLSTPTPSETPAPRIGFFARLFWRGRRRQALPEAASVDPVEAQAPLPDEEPAPIEVPITEAPDPELAAEPLAEVGSEPEPEPDPEPVAVVEPVLAEPTGTADDETAAVQPDLAAELKAAEEAAEEEVRAILKSVLDRLGAAHHRPFSRA